MTGRPARVVVAMSGGVDSSVTAALLKRAGHEVVGITLQLYSAAAKRKGACCAGQDIADAKRVAQSLGITHYVLDYEARFRERVIADFAQTYARGETPIPCVRCNERVKFADLMETARSLGAEALATGHYVRRVDCAGGPELHRATDATRDQSYFLFATTREQLAFLRFPLGGMEKAEVRALAAELGLDVAAKPDSQDICFVPDGRYAGIVARMAPEAERPGEIVDAQGHVLGEHPGVIHFTVGQRKGLNLAGNAEPLFVLALDAANARVIVGPRAALATRSIVLREVNWLSEARAPFECSIKVRSMRPSVAARVIPGPDRTAQVELLAPEEAVAPGQACVFYDGSRVLGGGWIAKAEPARKAA
ncbi:MAG: tRNA 2-thiouridine(34) synthase MnmA [Alphaproteobacteria bacterium]|nr:tRNA 2-thiouridine(34) synthase MnmA [Alphaproteobacteria bacterium]MBV9692540.1 tRNA 2-thiouridine(34) synthase MnmA [Alphaproteobacteria bacterium]